MTTEKFVREVRLQAIDEMVAAYGNMFTETSLSDYTNVAMRELAEFWLAVEPSRRQTLLKFVRLGAQNSISSILHMLDEDCSLTLAESERRADDLSGELLDEFWMQEETDGHVNQST